ncbi:MAG: ATP phosphoribosyltransferase regulatory subunit, partial [Chloroflexi bacterium]|nr:ATP phosphoribosyltransferase regulatory subunit [Chloroflexota bacterium]
HNLSEPAKLFIIGNVQDLKHGRTDVGTLRQRAEDVGLLRVGFDQSIGSALDGISMEAAQEFIQGALKDSMPAPIGQRTGEQIVARLLRKVRIADDPRVFEEALTLISMLAQLDGSPESVLGEARRIALERGMKSDSFDELDKLINALVSRGVSEDSLTLDLGLVRGIAYYTGVIFELHVSSAKGASLGGGGRYDSLVKALGGEDDVPALGFAYNMDEVLSALDPSKEGR